MCWPGRSGSRRLYAPLGIWLISARQAFGQSIDSSTITRPPGSHAAYTGEVLRRNLGGQWQTNDADPEGELNVALTLPVGDVVFPVQRVMKRFKNGTEDSVAAYGAALGLVVGPDPKPARRRLFGR